MTCAMTKTFCVTMTMEPVSVAVNSDSNLASKFLSGVVSYDPGHLMPHVFLCVGGTGSLSSCN